jgi:hypothetical protein
MDGYKLHYERIEHGPTTIRQTGTRVWFKYTDLKRYNYFIGCYNSDSCQIPDREVSPAKFVWLPYKYLFLATTSRSGTKSCYHRFGVTIVGLIAVFILQYLLYLIFFYWIPTWFTNDQDSIDNSRKVGMPIIAFLCFLFYFAGLIIRILGLITYYKNSKIISYFGMYERMIRDDHFVANFVHDCNNEFYEMDRSDFYTKVQAQGLQMSNLQYNAIMAQHFQINTKVRFMVYNNDWKEENDLMYTDLTSPLVTFLMFAFVAVLLIFNISIYNFYITNTK